MSVNERLVVKKMANAIVFFCFIMLLLLEKGCKFMKYFPPVQLFIHFIYSITKESLSSFALP